MRETAESSFSELYQALSAISEGAIVISAVALFILVLWESPWFKKLAALKLVPGPLIAVLWGVAYNELATALAPEWAVKDEHRVNLPVSGTINEFFGNFMLPDFSFLTNPQVYVVAATLAIIASLETLLSLEATDKLDPLKRLAPTNRELKAQGVGNIVSGLLGGLPITAVIVRSSANINAGGKTRLSCFVHGVFLLLSIMLFAQYLNYIPLACLSAILLHTGYKLAKPSLFKEYYKKGMSQLLPFVITVVAILASDLLIGMAIGVVVGLFFVIRNNFHAAITLIENGSHYTLVLNKDVSFLNKALLRKFILRIQDNSTVTIDASKAKFIDHDILETIEDFLATAPDDNIIVEVVDLHGKDKLHEHESLVILD
jgi:MFS superfamily sulfate permease-like transporter